MLFELTNASITCQNVVNNTFREYFDIIIVTYLNDILIFSKILKKHEKHVRQILKILNEKNFLFKSKKCEFHKQKVNFCEFKINIKKIKIDSNKLKFVQNSLIFKNVKKIQKFFEFMNYNRKFIAKFSKKNFIVNNINETKYKMKMKQKRTKSI